MLRARRLDALAVFMMSVSVVTALTSLLKRPNRTPIPPPPPPARNQAAGRSRGIAISMWKHAASYGSASDGVGPGNVPGAGADPA